MADPTCPECNLPLSSREHREGLNGIHDAPTAPPPAVDDAPEGEPSDAWTRQQLVDHAENLGIEIPAKATKAQILELLAAPVPAANAGVPPGETPPAP